MKSQYNSGVKSIRNPVPLALCAQIYLSIYNNSTDLNKSPHAVPVGSEDPNDIIQGLWSEAQWYTMPNDIEHCPQDHSTLADGYITIQCVISPRRFINQTYKIGEIIQARRKNFVKSFPSWAGKTSIARPDSWEIVTSNQCHRTQDRNCALIRHGTRDRNHAVA